MGYLRKAGPQDAGLFDGHIKWPGETLEKKNVSQYIYIDDEEPAGQAIVNVNGWEAEVGYSICMEKRCLGYGKDMLGLLQKQVRQDLPQIEKMTVKVKPQDTASQKILMDLGYEEKEDVFELNIKEAEICCEVPETVRGGVLFLTNNRNALGLYEWLRKRYGVLLYSDRLELCQIQKMQPEMVVSYNYKYLIQDSIIQYTSGRIFNLHISFLPWNRGVSPNIWSFIDDTPKGVTIHQVNAGLDTGKILYQKQCFFDPGKETFASAYEKLNQVAVELFKEKWDEIRFHNYVLTEQKGEGSYHSKKDLQVLKERTGFRWDENIADFLHRYKKIK